VSTIGPQAARFLAVGAGATAIHVAVALLLNGPLGVPPLQANGIAFLLAWGFSYFGNWRWTFGAASDHRSAGPRFFAVSLLLFCLNQGIVFIAFDRLGWPFWAALAVVVAIVPAAGFAASRLWAFLPR
jgi:putative flippase GtrA